MHKQNIKMKRKAPSISSDPSATIFEQQQASFGKPRGSMTRSRPEDLYPEVAPSRNKLKPILQDKVVKAKHDTPMQKRSKDKLKGKSVERSKSK